MRVVTATRARRQGAAALLAALVLVPLTACTFGTGGTPEPSYSPVPDDELFARIDELPHVTGSRVSFRDNATEGKVYTGSITLDGSVNPFETLDEAAAILRQGRPAAGILLAAKGPTGREYTTSEFTGYTEKELAERYGSQPGDGRPPSDRPVPTPTGWTPEPSAAG